MIRSLRNAMLALVGIASVLSLPSAIQANETHMAVLNSGLPTERSITLSAGWSFFSFNANPVLNEPERVFEGIDIDGRLYGFNPFSTTIEGRTIQYNQKNKYKFGPIYQNLGYWINLSEDKTITYLGTDPYAETGTWLHEGWNMIAYPYDQPQRVESLMIRSHETGDEISFSVARQQGIVDAVMYGWTNDWQQGLFDIGLEEDWASNFCMEAGHAYWIQALKDGYDIVIRQSAASQDTVCIAQ